MHTKTRHQVAAARHHSLAVHRRVTFCCSAPTAEGVRGVGDFSGWDLAATPMRRATRSRWVASLALNPGSYSHLLIVDGKHMLDPNADVTSGNEQVSRITIS